MTEERKTRVHRSLREMENSANELADFLDDQRNRRRTVEIVVNQGNWALNFLGERSREKNMFKNNANT